MNEDDEPTRGGATVWREGGLRARPGADASAGEVSTSVGDSIVRAAEGAESMVSHLAEAARAEAAVGPAQSVGGRTLVPLAAVSVSAGWGLGFGGGSGSDANSSQGSGSGGGGG